MFDKLMEHKVTLGLAFFSIGMFTSDYFQLINSTIFFGFMGGGLLVASMIKYVIDC